MSGEAFLKGRRGNDGSIRPAPISWIKLRHGETNADPKPFVWTAYPKRILAAVKRGKQTLVTPLVPLFLEGKS